jgi:hypothetical protein
MQRAEQQAQHREPAMGDALMRGSGNTQKLMAT